jgi:hypothetical protein
MVGGIMKLFDLDGLTLSVAHVLKVFGGGAIERAVIVGSFDDRVRGMDKDATFFAVGVENFMLAVGDGAFGHEGFLVIKIICYNYY